MLDAFEWLRERSETAATRWLANLEDAIRSLEQFPERCSLAPENEVFEEEIRQLLFGKDHGIYRVLFTVRGNEVHILHFRHSARRAPED
ncbi:MAG: type II toxin-antitoxin system RelE/ParE family toxin [Candidatus Eisenbacteria bacterium]|nr:type II toxin-antitoxin system RelE/ParE family toxin [Candidatus Eisenbacteria bacterium]